MPELRLAVARLIETGADAREAGLGLQAGRQAMIDGAARDLGQRPGRRAGHLGLESGVGPHLGRHPGHAVEHQAQGRVDAGLGLHAALERRTDDAHAGADVVDAREAAVVPDTGLDFQALCGTHLHFGPHHTLQVLSLIHISQGIVR